MTTTRAVLGALLLSLFSGAANAVILSLTPSTQSIDIGAIAQIDLNISGLGDAGAPSLGAFEVEITYDSSIASLSSFSYGQLLGSTDPSDFETDILTTLSPNSIVLDETSFLFDFELDALQSSSFTLATLSFTGQALGTSALGFGQIDLSDAEFPASSIPVTGLETAAITVGRTVSVPEPGVWALLLLGTTLLLIRRRQERAAT